MDSMMTLKLLQTEFSLYYLKSCDLGEILLVNSETQISSYIWIRVMN